MSAISHSQVTEQVNSVSEQVERPGIVSAICILRWIGVVLTIGIVAFLPASQSSFISAEIGSWFLPYLLLDALASIVICGGLWTMKRWAAYAFLLQNALGVFIALVANVVDPVSIGMSVCFTFFVMNYSTKMH